MFTLNQAYKRTIILLVLISSQSYAQYHIKTYTINSGGGNSSSSQFQLSASIGQVDASESLTVDTYEMNGGFWHQNNDLIFKNKFDI